MNRLRLILLIALIGGFMANGWAMVYDVREFGARGDGRHIDSPAINAALLQAAGHSDTVVLAGGTFLCYSVHLQSGVTLLIEKGAVLKAAPAFTHCRGLALETVDGAEMRDINVSDLTMNDICNSPIYIRLGDRMRAPEDFHPSAVSGIRISNVRVTDADSRYACLIAGIGGHPVRDVVIENISIQYRGGLTLQDVEAQRGSNPFFYKPRRNTGRFGMKAYPEPAAHGIQPAWGFSISDAENILLRNIRMELMQPDERPPFYLHNTRSIRLEDSPFSLP